MVCLMHRTSFYFVIRMSPPCQPDHYLIEHHETNEQDPLQVLHYQTETRLRYCPIVRCLSVFAIVCLQSDPNGRPSRRIPPFSWPIAVFDQKINAPNRKYPHQQQRVLSHFQQYPIASDARNAHDGYFPTLYHSVPCTWRYPVAGQLKANVVQYVPNTKRRVYLDF
ncbi:hypothetical protein D3C81_666940 [compost metagenome]